MKKMRYTIGAIASLLVLLFCGCEQNGWDEGKLYVVKSFQSVNDVTGEGNYGRVFLTWQLPDSTSSLNYVDVCWKDTENREGHKVFSKYQDSVWITGLVESNYTFEVISCSEAGEKVSSPELKLAVADWQKEPAAMIEGFAPMVAENFLFIDWKHPQHITYAGVHFRLYQGEELVGETLVTKGKAPEYTFSELKFSTDYKLVYHSVNLLDIESGNGEYSFRTGLPAPQVPEVSLGDRTVYAHCADVTWTPTVDMDSVLIKFVDMNGSKREFRFGSDGGKGYLSLLPGGTIQVDAQARGTNGTWSLPKTQKIKTPLKEEMVHINDGKVGECLAEKLGASGSTKDYSFEQLSTIKEVTMKYQIAKIDEIELLVNLEKLQMEASYPPGLQESPTVEAFLSLIARLPKIKELRVQKNWPRSADLQKAFANHPKVKFILN